MDSRRNDIGQKIMIGLVLGGFGTVVGFFVNTSWSMANEGRMKADQALNRASVLEAQFSGLAGDLKEIKDLLKRRIPL